MTTENKPVEAKVETPAVETPKPAKAPSFQP